MSEPTKKRTVLTDAERIAKAEAELAKLKEKAELKNRKTIDRLLQQRSTQVRRLEVIEARIAEIDNELDRLGYEFVDRALAESVED